MFYMLQSEAKRFEQRSAVEPFLTFYLLVFHIVTVQMHMSVPLIFDFDYKML